MFLSTEKGLRPLEYYMHDDPDAFRMELAGSLTLATAESAYQAWRTALSTLGGRLAFVDITFVDRADERGRNLLRLWHNSGARIVARSPESRALASGIPLEPTAREQSAQSFIGRLMTLRRRAFSKNRKAFGMSAGRAKDEDVLDRPGKGGRKRALAGCYAARCKML